MKTRGWMTVALVLTLSLSALAEDDAQGKGEGRKPFFKQDQRQGGENRERRGKGPRDGSLEQLIKDIPGAEAEIERHQQAMEAIREKARAEMKKLRETAPQEGAAEQIQAQREAVIKANVTESVDEQLRHAQAMVDLRKANRDAMIAKMTEEMLKRGPGEGRGQNEGMKKRGDAEQPAPAGQTQNQADDADLAEALREALQ